MTRDRQPKDKQDTAALAAVVHIWQALPSGTMTLGLCDSMRKKWIRSVDAPKRQIWFHNRKNILAELDWSSWVLQTPLQGPGPACGPLVSDVLILWRRLG